jgi:hypothetical protein
MTATAFIDAIQKMAHLRPLQADQLIKLAPFMTDAERKDTLASVQQAHTEIDADVKEVDWVQTQVEKETQEIYKKEWPKVKEAMQTAEREAAASKLDEQIDAA